jgi:hypothetical protein
MWKIPALGGILLVISACAGTIIVQEPVYEQIFTDGDTEFAMQNGEILTRVYGSPFSPGNKGIERSVTRLMKGANLGPKVDFTPKPSGEGSEPYHVVMVFNAPRYVLAESICTDGASVGSTPAGGSLTLLSGFCIGDTLLSTASGSVSGVSSPNDPKFRLLVREVTLSLFPAYDHHDIGGENRNT